MANFLIVDDSKFSRTVIKEAVEEIGHSVVAEGKDGVDTLPLYESNEIDFVLTDLEMPTMDGISGAKALLEKHKDAKIIMITSVINNAVVAKAINAGIKKVLNKPVDSDSLKLSINELER